MMVNSLCTCGKPGTYMFIQSGDEPDYYACNKYGPCPTYDELQKELSKAKAELHHVCNIALDNVVVTSYQSQPELNKNDDMVRVVIDLSIGSYLNMKKYIKI